MSFLNITGVDLKDVAKAAYRFSQPQGLGFVHFQDGDLSDKDAESILASGCRENCHGDGIPLSMDYVHGRACKMTVWQRNGELFIRDSWYDHTPYDLQDFLKTIGRADATKVEELPERVAA